MPARSRSQNGARAPRHKNSCEQRALNTNLILANHDDGERPQSIGPPPPPGERTCPRLADWSSVTSGNQSQCVDSGRRRRRTRRRRTRTTTVPTCDSRVEGPTHTTSTTTTTTTTNLRTRRAANGGQPFGNILLPLNAALAATLLLLTLFSAQTFALATVGAGEHWPQRASVVGHPQHQVDARLIPRADESSDAAPKMEEEEEEVQRATLVRRSNADQLSSAELPAEFRGDSQPREQSRLARLCEQTSSVLASVLPAPFGGHKRSILCQFFGQVQVGGAGGSSGAGKQRLASMAQAQPQPVYPLSGLSSSPRIQFPVAGGGQFEPAQESIAILHQSQRPPVALVATGRHPIQMVLEHQRRQLQANHRPVSTGWSNSRQPAQDLSVESSIRDSRVALQELAKPPANQKQIKFSAPLATSPAIASSSPTASSPQMSSSGWRISNGTSLPPASSPHQDTSAAAPSSSTTPMPSVNRTSPTPASEPAASEPRTGAVQLSIGKRISETPHKSTPAVRLQPSTSKANEGASQRDRVRTIEVSAQEVAADQPATRQTQDSGASTPKPSDARQVQKREELVIASINNLTRIAFGNQLRDTVKVINKLIDQQAAVFGQQQQPGELLMASQDPMQMSESVGRPVMIFRPPGDKARDLQAKPKLSGDSYKDEHGKVTLTSPKLDSGSSSGSAGTARDNLKTTGKSQRQQAVVAAASAQPKLGQKTGNNINDKPGEGLGEQFTTRQERISPSPAAATNNKLRSTTTTAAASKLAKPPPSGSPKMATGVGQKSAGASNKKATPPVKKQQNVAAAAGTRASSPKKSAKESGQASRATNHSQRAAGKFSQASSAPTRAKDRKQQQNQSSTASVELRRLTTIGRALIMQNGDGTTASGKQARAIDGVRKSQSEMDLAMAQTINDPSRPPVTSTWLPSRGPAGSSTTPKMMPNTTPVKIRHNAFESRLALTSWTSTSSAVQAQSSTVTQFPWLLPDKSALASSETSDLSPASSSVLPSAEVRTVQIDDAHQPAGASSSSTRRMVTPYDSDQFSFAFASASSSKRTPLVLNRIETTRPDSLATLKMALTRAKTTSTPQPPATETATPIRSTRLPLSAGTTQSRWLPSTAFLTRLPATAATTTAGPNTIVSSTSPAAPPSASSTLGITVNSYGSPSTVAAGGSTSELDEARASETISKYTTHLSDAANELIGSATKRGHSQQPLPQIANTGDYFSAETIASWPEKYHTMVSQAMSGSGASQPARTTAGFETTRRNGETYETPADSPASPAVAATLSRHRLDAATSQAVGETTRPAGLLVGVVSSNAPGITILPANHKLLAPGSSSPTESEPSPTQELRSVTRPMDARPGESTETPPLPSKQPLPPYTLLESAMPADNSSSQEISQTTVGGAPTLAANSTSGDTMRPPYHANYEFSLQQLSDPTLVLDANQSSPYVSRKLYELLTPGGSHSQTFAGAAHPARSQRFNWSALKYLAQNLLMATTHGRHNDTNVPTNFTTTDGDEEGANDTEQQQVAAGQTDQQRLYDFMTRSSLPPLNDYYELASNDSAAHQLQGPANELQNGPYQGKGIFERASNLLSEMKQLEQKRAAALMAAFRYQVPGPLVKPWDPIAQAAHHSSTSISKFFSDRLDASAAGSNRAAPPSGALSPAQLLAALKSALFKQKLVARDELEARLNAGRRADHQVSLERRGDGEQATSEQSTKDEQLELSLEGLSPHGNSTISLDDLEYILGANETALGQDAAMLSGPGNSTTLLKTMLGRLFSGGNSSSQATNSSGQAERDFHLIDLSANAGKQSSQPAETGRPKYIRLLDYQTALTRKPLDDKARQMFAPTGSNRQAVAEVMARLRTPAMGAAVTAATEPSIGFERASKQQAAASESGQDKPATDPTFDCDGRSPGFYPDAGSLCQTFYHCSNTGHLLTFNCPTSTRFDEKSLKCGPWYEVSCDIGRVRTRRY